MGAADRPAVVDIIMAVGNFNPAERDCALELVEIFLQGGGQKDYCIAIAVDSDAAVRGYACWGPTPLTSATYDLYWIATHPSYFLLCCNGVTHSQTSSILE